MVRKRKKEEKQGEVPGELSSVILEAKKRYGDATVCKASETPPVRRISTGSFILDFCTLGGIPENRASLLIGDKHSGKTTISMKTLASCQRMNPDMNAVLLDIEGTFDRVWASKLGVDVDSLILSQPDTGEMAVDLADAIIGSRECSLLVVDSLAALLPTKEAESSAEDHHIGLQARLINSMVRKLQGSLVRERKRDHYPTIVFINQFRTKIGGFSPSGNPRTMPGGRAVEHMMSLSVTLKNKESKGKDSFGIETVTHSEHPFSITKNKLNSGPRSGEFTLYHNKDNDAELPAGSIDNAPTMLAYAKKFGVYTGGGSKWILSFGDTSRTYGKAQEAIYDLRNDEELMRDLWVHLLQLQAVNVGQSDDMLDLIEDMYAL